jgi:hypothetical protein
VSHRPWFSPALVCATLGPIVLTNWVMLATRLDYSFETLGKVQNDRSATEDIYIEVVTEKLWIVDRTEVRFYSIPMFTQNPRSWLGTPVMPDAAMILDGVRLAESEPNFEDNRVVELIRAGGGSAWQLHNGLVALWLTNFVATLVFFVSLVSLTKFFARRRRAQRMMNRKQLGLCPSCEYGLGGVNTERCPECGGELRAIEQSAQRVLRRGWFFRA